MNQSAKGKGGIEVLSSFDPALSKHGYGVGWGRGGGALTTRQLLPPCPPHLPASPRCSSLAGSRQSFGAAASSRSRQPQQRQQLEAARLAGG